MTSSTTLRATELARNARYALSFAARTFREDPLWLTVQAVRRAPARLRGPLTRALRIAPEPSAPHALAQLLSGDQASAAREAAELLSGEHGPRGRRVGAEVAIAVGRADLLDDAAVDGPASYRAAWLRGDVDVIEKALATGADDVPLGLRSQVAALQPALRPIPQAAARPFGAPAVATAPAAGSASARPAPGLRSSTIAVLHHLTNSLPHTQSGYTLRTHSVLTAQRTAGIEALATTRPGYPLTIGSLGARSTDVVDGVPYRRLIPRRTTTDPAARVDAEARLLADTARAAGAQVLHTTTPSATGEVARRAAGILGVPWVYEVRGLPEETWAASHPTPEARARAAASRRHDLMQAKETELACAAHAVVTLSATMRETLIGRGVPGAKITVAPNGVPAELLATRHPEPPDARTRLGLPEAFTIGSVGSIVDYEGLETTIHAVARLRADGHDVRAALVGDGVARPGLQRLVRSLGLDAHVTLPGRVPRDAALTWLAALDVVLVPRRDHSVTRLVTPLKPVEAMAVGRPVLASNLPALAEAVGGAGVLVPPADAAAWAGAVARLHTNPEHRAELVSRGRDVASGRTWGRNAETYAAMYRGLLGGNA
ncbi:glycosyltransferase family 4 protein [Myceligenerans pegani]|uniref:D-inositol 3-phosphate glycosyltransferase n=1 Tax=Myceligenerans pegani TaxID=2776917 RepID=A0ABR9N0E5_9MICO|nr:glycosyltransferase family 4 protein [Myceligenerans sp. TRM 65318]MBE1877130.1 glycosyltransferase [Myceligenerans sp. TRM 65318]MBE3019401.1 glycosyltransferase [Myceligenerans sp. TRM 65318]